MNTNDQKQSHYCGNAQSVTTNTGKVGFNIDLDLTELKAHLLNQEIAGLIRKWKDKNGVEHRTIRLAMWPLKEPTEHRSHSLKINTFKPDPAKAKTPAQTAQPKNEQQENDPF